jgi:predicted NodU family carbamoyl transferase
LSKLENRGHIPVLLNTSFNIQGNPILNRYADAILIRDTTGLDKVITDKFLLK